VDLKTAAYLEDGSLTVDGKGASMIINEKER
jgi:hypothetical protein